VPTAYGHREVLIRGYVHEVVISCGAEVIARHPRSYEREDFVFHPLHYLALLERKIGALDQAAPLVGWDLPEEFATLRRLIEARMAKRGGVHEDVLPAAIPTDEAKPLGGVVPLHRPHLLDARLQDLSV
jgi:hypothetical protein